MSDGLVKFGAQLDDLIDGVKGAKEAIESVGESTDKITEGFKTLAEVAGVSISIEGFKSFVESMAELGSRTTDSMARLGDSADQITALQGVASVAGLSFETLQQSIEKGSLTVQKSLKDAYNPAAAGLKALGLNARELTGIPTDQWFSKVADAVAKFNPSLNLTNAVTLAFGKGAAAMLPLLQQGSEHFEELQAAVKRAQEGLAEAIPGMDAVHEKLALMQLSVQSLSARIFSTLEPAISGAIEWFTNLVQSINSDTIRDVANQIGNSLIDIGQYVAEFLVKAGVSIDVFKGKFASLVPSLDGYVDGIAGAIVRTAQGLHDPIDQVLKKIRDEWSVPIRFKIGGVDSGEDPTARLSEQLDAIRAKADQARAALNAVVPTSGTWGAVAQDVGRLNSEVLTATASFLKMNAAASNVGGKDQVGKQAARIEAEISAEQAKFARIKEILSQEANAYEITEQQKAVYTETALKQMYDAEMASIEKKIALYPKDTKAYEDAQKEKAKLTQDYQKQMVATVDASQQQMRQTVEGYLSTFTGSFNSSLKGLITGTTSWANAMKNVASGLFMKMIEEVEGWAVKHASVMIADSLLQKTQAASQLVAQAAAEAAKTEAVVTGAAARTAAETTGSAAGIGTQIANAVTSVAIDAGKVFAGVFGFLAPVMGPAASGPAEASSAAALAAGMAPLAVGAWEIPSVMPALLHPGEMVMPANFASGFRSAAAAGGNGSGGQGGPQIVFAPNVSSFNPAGMQSTLRSMMPQLATMLKQYQNLNPSTA